jgi:IS30 family transposase
VSSYKRLGLEEREEISRQLSQGEGIRKIAKLLKRSASTISREVGQASMNRWTYRAVRSQNRAERQSRGRRWNKRKLWMQKRLWAYVRKKLLTRWSPGQIAKRIVNDYPDDQAMRISAEAIYGTVYVMPRGELKRQLLNALRQGHKRRHRRVRGGQPIVLKPLQDMVSIEARPAEVEGRLIPGHWEGDLMIGQNRQSSLGTLVERKTRFTLLVRTKNRTAKQVRSAFSRVIRRLPSALKKSLTYDQGREMAEHRRLTETTNVQVYFAHPASPWERGTNENTNGLLRQYFPKGTDFNKVTDWEIKRAQHQLNGRPRQCLNFMTPAEEFAKCCVKN